MPARMIGGMRVETFHEMQIAVAQPGKGGAQQRFTLTVAVSAERAGGTTIATQIINGERVQVQRRRTPLLAVRVRISPVVHHQNGRTNPNSTSSSHTYVFLAS